MTVLDSITALKVGRIVLDRFHEELSKKNFTYKEFQELQNDYERIMKELLLEAYEKGKNDMSKDEFMKWLNEVSAYEDLKEAEGK